MVIKHLNNENNGLVLKTVRPTCVRTKHLVKSELPKAVAVVFSGNAKSISD